MTDPHLSIGQPAPDFTLPDLGAQLHSLAEARGRVAILNFWSAECPWSERVDRELLPALQSWGESLVFFSIASNANETLELLKQVSEERRLPLVLLDSQHEVADLYGAQTTPHFFLIDPQGILRYQGAFDDVTFRQRRPAHNYLLPAVERVLAGALPDLSETPTFGCTIVRYKDRD